MFAEYIQAAMDQATYEIIDNPEPFYREVTAGLLKDAEERASGGSQVEIRKYVAA